MSLGNVLTFVNITKNVMGMNYVGHGTRENLLSNIHLIKRIFVLNGWTMNKKSKE